MSPRIRRALMGLLWLVPVVGAPGCNSLTGVANVAQYVFKIPPGHPARPKMSADDSALVYPDIDHLGRDPFLSLAEEALYDHKELAVAEDPGIPAPPTDKHVVRKPRTHAVVDTVVAQLKAQVRQIILGRHNTFIFKDKYYEEGDNIDGSEWMVVSINEAHIKLRTKDGKQDQTLNFGTATPDKGFSITPSH